MKSAFAYHRYSYIDQKDGYTLEIQRKTTQKLSEKYNCKILGVYEDEAISGATIDKRPGMIKLLEDLNGNIDYVICIDQDRLSRSNELWLIKAKMSEHNVSLITEKEGLIDFKNDIMKDALSDMMGVFAKLERGMIARRVKRAMVERVEKGMCSGNLTRIFGYDWDKETKNIKVNESEAKIVRIIFDMYNEGKGYHLIAKYLNKDGYKTKLGSLFTASTVQHILKKPIYCGYIVSKSKLIKGIHKPIISERDFEKAKKRYEMNKKRSPKMNAKNLLVGFIFCGSCNSRMFIGYHGKKKFYGCSGYYKTICKNPVYISKDKVEGYIENKVIEHLENLNLDFDERIKNYTAGFFDIEKEKRKIEDKIGRLVEEYIEGNITKEQYQKLDDRYRLELSRIKLNNNAPDLSFLKEMDIKEIYRELPFQDKRKILELLINKIIIYRGSSAKPINNKVKIEWNL